VEAEAAADEMASLQHHPAAAAAAHPQTLLTSLPRQQPFCHRYLQLMMPAFPAALAAAWSYR
jgi:hypothetical protein